MGDKTWDISEAHEIGDWEGRSGSNRIGRKTQLINFTCLVDGTENTSLPLMVDALRLERAL